MSDEVFKDEKPKYTTIELEPKDDMQRLALTVVMQEGALRYREELAKKIKDKICFDNLEGRGCNHQGCYALLDILAEVEI